MGRVIIIPTFYSHRDSSRWVFLLPPQNEETEAERGRQFLPISTVMQRQSWVHTQICLAPKTKPLITLLSHLQDSRKEQVTWFVGLVLPYKKHETVNKSFNFSRA